MYVHETYWLIVHSTNMYNNYATDDKHDVIKAMKSCLLCHAELLKKS